jgi:hypothetical protein
MTHAPPSRPVGSVNAQPGAVRGRHGTASEEVDPLPSSGQERA